MNENTALAKIQKDVEEIKSKLNCLTTIMMERMAPDEIDDFEKALQEYQSGKTTKLSAMHW